LSDKLISHVIFLEIPELHSLTKCCLGKLIFLSTSLIILHMMKIWTNGRTDCVLHDQFSLNGAVHSVGSRNWKYLLRFRHLTFTNLHFYVCNIIWAEANVKQLQ
jgi:hypothetical protein